MQDIEPFYRWRDLYRAEDDRLSPFYNREYSEFEYSNRIYNYLIHPQWDEFGSPTLYIKILYADYRQGYAIIELIGEWNDAIHNDVMMFKREIAEVLMAEGVNRFILIGENVLNFHCSDDCYYEEWFQELEDGWIAAINFQQHVLDEFTQANIDFYLVFGGELNALNWRKLSPQQLFNSVTQTMQKRLG